MAITNQAYMKASTAPQADECLTPLTVVTPIIPFIQAKQFKTIWCPFDKEDSYYVRAFKHYGFNVIHSHIEDGQDFFNYEPTDSYDCIVSNPPFSKKINIVTRLYKLDKPFAVLLPQNALQHKKLTQLYMKNGLEYLGFNTRASFFTRGNLGSLKHHNFFASGYFCHNVLPEKLMFSNLEIKSESYYDEILDNPK